MKNTIKINHALLVVALVANAMLISSCENQGQEDTKKTAENRNDDRFDDNKQEKDAQFLVNASEINLEEILLGQLAQQKGMSTQVKEMGRMMEDAHTKSQNDLNALANSKSISIPNTATQNAKDAYNKLNDKSGEDFDKAYADLMVERHEDAIKLYEDATTESNDQEIKNWAIASLPNLRIHLDHSNSSKENFNNRNSNDNNFNNNSDNNNNQNNNMNNNNSNNNR